MLNNKQHSTGALKQAGNWVLPHCTTLPIIFPPFFFYKRKNRNSPTTMPVSAVETSPLIHRSFAYEKPTFTSHKMALFHFIF